MIPIAIVFCLESGDVWDGPLGTVYLPLPREDSLQGAAARVKSAATDY